jgi:hypothetical protein
MIHFFKHARRLAMTASVLAAMSGAASRSVAAEFFRGYGATSAPRSYGYNPYGVTYDPYGWGDSGPAWYGGYDRYGYDAFGYDYYGYPYDAGGYDDFLDDGWYDYGYGW